MRDTVTGEAHNWRGHIQGALSCLADPSGVEVRPGSSLHIVLEQFLCLAVFGNVTTSYNLDALIFRLLESVSYMCQYHSINKFILRAILRIDQYVGGSANRSPSTSHDAATDITGSSFLDMERLELQAYLHAPTTAAAEEYQRQEDAAVAMHYSNVYYYALLIYLQRSVHRRPEHLEEMVERALSHLESAEEIAGGSNGCIFLWPCLVIAAECNTSFMKARALASSMPSQSSSSSDSSPAPRPRLQHARSLSR